MTTHEKQIARDHARLLENLKRIQKNYSVAELADLLGISKVTWISRMKEPWRLFSYENLRSIARYCHIDFVQLVDGEIKLR